MSSISIILKNIGLSDTAIKVYLNCLGLGPISKSEIASVVQIAAEEVDKAIEELKKHNLVVELKTVPVRYQMIAPYALFVTQLENFGKSFDAFMENIRKTVEVSTKETANAIAEFQSKISEATEVSLKGMRESITSLAKDFTKSTVDAIEETSKNILESLTEATATSMESIRSVAKSISEGMQKLSSETQKMMQSVIEQIGASLSEMREGIMKQFESSMKVLSDALATLIEQISAMLRKTFDDFQAQVKTSLDTFKKSLESMEQSTKSRMQETGSKFVNEMNETMESMISSLNSKIEETSKRIEEVKTQSMNTMQESITGLSNRISQRAEDFANKLSEKMKNTVSSLMKEVEDSANKLKIQIEKTLIENISKSLQQMRQALEDTKNIFSELYEEIRKKETPVEVPTFFQVKGLESIKAHIRDMLTRAKRVVYIAVRDPTDLPWKKILELPERCRVYILTCFNRGHPEHRSIIQRLLKRPFTHIREIRQPRFFATEIDDKEGAITMLIPGVPPSELDCIVVLSEPWAFLIKSIFMSEYSGAEEIRL